VIGTGSGNPTASSRLRCCSPETLDATRTCTSSRYAASATWAGWVRLSQLSNSGGVASAAAGLAGTGIQHGAIVPPRCGGGGDATPQAARQAWPAALASATQDPAARRRCTGLRSAPARQRHRTTLTRRSCTTRPCLRLICCHCFVMRGRSSLDPSNQECSYIEPRLLEYILRMPTPWQWLAPSWLSRSSMCLRSRSIRHHQEFGSTQ
jgi:hypothetical protein